MYALAHELGQRGHHITFATQSQHEVATRSLGFSVVVINQAQQKPKYKLLKQVPQILSAENIAFEIAVLETAAAQADLLIGTTLVFFGALIAKKLHKPWVYCPLSPLALPSRYDYSLFPYLQPLQRKEWNYPQLHQFYLNLARAAIYWLSFRLIKQRQALEAHNWQHPFLKAFIRMILIYYLHHRY